MGGPGGAHVDRERPLLACPWGFAVRQPLQDLHAKLGSLHHCALLDGSSCGIGKAYIQQYREDLDVLFGIEHRIRRGAEQQFNKLAKSNLKTAVDEARDIEGAQFRNFRSKRQVWSSSLLMVYCRLSSTKKKDQ